MRCQLKQEAKEIAMFALKTELDVLRQKKKQEEEDDEKTFQPVY